MMKLLSSACIILTVLTVSRSSEGKHTRIVGGKGTDVCELKYQVRIKDARSTPETIMCGGSIIGKEWVLTAAHCLYLYKSHPEDLRVITGDYNVAIKEESEQTFKISKMYIHEKYSPDLFSYDIAMLRLSSAINFDNCSNSIQLPEENQTSSGSCVISGWGVLEEGGFTSDILQRANVTIMPQAGCMERYEENYDSRMICAGTTDGGVDSCQGDSGGPLACEESGTTYQAGIVSWGFGCAREGYPGVYTDTSSYIDWIKDQMKNEAEASTPNNGNQPKIVGGRATYPCELKYQVRIIDDRTNPWTVMCGGSIIGKEWVLTAAHCIYFFKSKTEVLRVVTGDYNRKSNEEHEQTLGISEIFIPEQYSPDLFFYDIALLRLSSAIRFDDCSYSIQLPKENQSSSGNCLISGWGLLSEFGHTADKLHKANVTILSRADCKEVYGNSYNSHMICAGRTEGGVDSCQGDSGGALACEDSGRTYQAGIVSWGYGCGRKGYPGIYTKTSKYISWMKDHMENGVEGFRHMVTSILVSVFLVVFVKVTITLY